MLSVLIPTLLLRFYASTLRFLLDSTLHTVDASEIRRENHLGCIKPCEYWDNLSTGAGFFSINSISIVVNQLHCPSPLVVGGVWDVASPSCACVPREVFLLENGSESFAG